MATETTAPQADLSIVAARAKAAGRRLAALSSGQKNDALTRMARALEARTGDILAENAKDVDQARAAEVGSALVDRLLLDESRIADMAKGVRDIAALPDPVGVIDTGWTLPNGLKVSKKRIPLGVIAVIYESRPNVTSDTAALALKSGNAIILRGSSMAARSNQIIVDVLLGALGDSEVPTDAVQLLGTDRADLERLIGMEGEIDVVIPRGGEGLKKFLGEHSRIPVIYAASGNCHVYVHEDADLEMAAGITMNAKTQRPGVCNAAETLLVHREVAAQFLPRIGRELSEAGVELRASDEAAKFMGDLEVTPASEEDFATEYLDLILAVGVVDSVEEATDHISRYGSGHSEAIVTSSLAAAGRFEAGIDSACVYINASTRFTDGGEFGMGAEVANSTQKLHARGPVGLAELTTYQYLVIGDGHLR
ncbi:MAG: glutamate-5-semialdehyde dehydrogenase [Thermoleophilia bacterium]|nr:glutamate-5-semialdehyde dehydrogenase [Thermoleophilia bacterium]